MQHRLHKFALGAVPLALTMALTGCNDNDEIVTPQPQWQMVWEDNFEGTEIDSTKWSHEVNCWGGGNNEEQCYVDSATNSYVEDGKLHIKAIRGDHTGPVYNPDHPEHLTAGDATKSFTSARLRSVAPKAYVEGADPEFDFRHDWTYGRFEIRAKLPEGQGTWPAIWMLPTDYAYGGWAASGEIDIMEAVNLKTTKSDGSIENHVHGTLHYGKAWPNNTSSGTGYDFNDPEFNPADEFVTYAIEWEEGEIRWYVDDVHYATQRKGGWWTQYQDEEENWVSSADTAAPFDRDFHLILNLAMGGWFPGDTAESLNEAEMIVDFVRIYQCSGDTATGKGCATVGDDAKELAGTVEPKLPGTETPVDTSGDVLDLFSDELAAGISLDGYDPEGGDVRELTDDGQISIQYVTGANAYLKAELPFDMGPYGDGGELSFDLTIVAGTADSLTVKMDSGYPNLAPLSISKDDWLDYGVPKKFTFGVDAFIAAGSDGFSIHKIANPVVFEPVNADGLHITLDNIQFTKGNGIEKPALPELPAMPEQGTAPSADAAFVFHTTSETSITGINNWFDSWGTGTPTLFPEDFGGTKVLHMTSVNAWGAFDAAVVGFNADSDISAHSVLRFKVKSEQLTSATVKIESPTGGVQELNYPFSEYGTPLADGWVEVEIDVPAYTDMSALGIFLMGQGTAWLTDIYFD